MKIFLLSLLLAQWGGNLSSTNSTGNIKEVFGGFLPNSKCLIFQNGSWTQICSPANGQLIVANNAATLEMILNVSGGIYGAAMISDTAPPAWYIQPPDAYPAATVNTTGANLYLAGSAGTKTVTFAAANPQTTCPTANSGGATTIVITTSPSGSATTYTFGTGWCVSGCTTATLAANAFAAYLTANPPTNGTGITAVNAAGVVQLTLPGTVQSLSTTFNGATCGSAANGTDGVVGISSPSGAGYITMSNPGSFNFGQSPGQSNADIHARYVEPIGSMIVLSAFGSGEIAHQGDALTGGTMTLLSVGGIVNVGPVRNFHQQATWTNAMITALGAVTSGTVSAFTIPAKGVIRNMYVIITGQAAGTTTLTVGCGRTSATFVDYIPASNAQVAANTIYGNTSGTRGANLTGYDMPSYSATTLVNCIFTSTGANLSAVTGSSGVVDFEYTIEP